LNLVAAVAVLGAMSAHFHKKCRLGRRPSWNNATNVWEILSAPAIAPIQKMLSRTIKRFRPGGRHELFTRFEARRTAGKAIVWRRSIGRRNVRRGVAFGNHRFQYRWQTHGWGKQHTAGRSCHTAKRVVSRFLGRTAASTQPQAQ